MDFQGFQNVLHPTLIVVIIVGLIGLSWASYRKFDSIPTLSRWLLISFRSTAFIIILLLLLNPYFYSENEIEIKPRIAVFLDNSESISTNKGDYSGLDSYNQLLDDLNLENIREADVEYYSVGEVVSENFSPDSLNGIEVLTNLSNPVSSILEMEDDVQAAVIISDGIITFGRNPIVNAYNSTIPIYTISVGDTTSVKDISISNILTNNTGYTNTNHLIEAEVTQTGFQNNTISISLVSNNEVLQQQEMTFETNDQVKKARFELELTEAGLKQYEIVAQPIPDEWSEENNSQVFSIDVLDDRVKILHVAFEIHPDVKALRTLIQQDENNELTPLTWVGGNRFIEDLPDEEEEFNLIVVHGVPNSSRSFTFLDDLENTPTIFLELSNQTKSQFSASNQLQLIRSNGQTSSIEIRVNENYADHPVLELPEIDLTDVSPLRSPVRSVIDAPQSTPLFNLVYNGIETEFPVISVLEIGNIRRSHILVRGWYKLFQSNNPTHREFAENLFTNIVAWTSSDPDDRMLQISPTKQVFSTAENPLIDANLRNERGEQESSGIIEVNISSADGTNNRNFNMDNIGNGNYRLNLPRLSEGLYEYSATARKGNRELETQTGEFLISNASSELANTTRNDELMRAIAQNSNGSHFVYNQVGGFRDSLLQANVLQSKTETVENYSFPVRSVFWFALVLVLLGSEWFLRKNYSLP